MAFSSTVSIPHGRFCEDEEKCTQSRDTRGEGGGRIVREFGIDVYTLLYLKEITDKDLLYSAGNSAQYPVIT